MCVRRRMDKGSGAQCAPPACAEDVSAKACPTGVVWGNPFFADLALGPDAGEGAPARAPQAWARHSRSMALRGAMHDMCWLTSSWKSWRDSFLTTVVLASRLRESAFMEERAALARDAACRVRVRMKFIPDYILQAP